MLSLATMRLTGWNAMAMTASERTCSSFARHSPSGVKSDARMHTTILEGKVGVIASRAGNNIEFIVGTGL